MLNDDEIKRLAEYGSALGEGLITPFNMDQLQPHSYDCTLGSEIKYPEFTPATNKMKFLGEGAMFEVFVPEKREWVSKDFRNGYHQLKSMGFALGGTMEYFKLPQDIVGFVQGKSTVGRNGLQIECAGLIDAGFEGNITLEFFNMAPWPIALKHGQKICQVHFTYVDSPVHKDYQKMGHYNKQTGATTPVYNL